MTLAELNDAMTRAEANGKYGIMLVVPWEAAGERVRLGRRSGPYGEILNVQNGQTVGIWEIEAVRRWIGAHESAAGTSIEPAPVGEGCSDRS